MYDKYPFFQNNKLSCKYKIFMTGYDYIEELFKNEQVGLVTGNGLCPCIELGKEQKTCIMSMHDNPLLHSNPIKRLH